MKRWWSRRWTTASAHRAGGHPGVRGLRAVPRRGLPRRPPPVGPVALVGLGGRCRRAGLHAHAALRTHAEGVQASIYAAAFRHGYGWAGHQGHRLAGRRGPGAVQLERGARRQAAEYHACLLSSSPALCLTGAANDLVTLFLALELISIPTYVLLYLPRTTRRAQEAAVKYFLLSIFSSALLLFGFSYLYGLAGTTNLPALLDAPERARSRPQAACRRSALVALVMVVAGLGFRITAVPFHFYAPDVYQGTATAGGGPAGVRAQGGRLRGPAPRARLRAAGSRARLRCNRRRCRWAARCRSCSGSWRPSR